MQIGTIGGYNEVGGNLTAITLDNETLIIDNGLMVDLLHSNNIQSEYIKEKNKNRLIRLGIIPDTSKIKGNIIAQIISHGHLDHIGAIQANKFKAPTFLTRFSACVAEKICSTENNFEISEYNEEKKIGKFKFSFIEVTHSIPHSSIILIKTEKGNVVYASDFKFDNYSLIAKPDYNSLKKAGSDGVKFLIVDSLNSKEEGKTPSESVAREKLKDVLTFANDGKLILVSTFSTHIERIAAIIKEAFRLGRKPIVIGKSMISNLEIAKNLNIVDSSMKDVKFIKKESTIKKLLNEIKNFKEDYLILCTGHQGEENSALSKISNFSENICQFDKRDSLIFSSKVIPTPTNQYNRYVLEEKFKRKGIRIFKDIHVSGHASKEEQRELINILKPEYIIPCHGNIEMKIKFAELAREEGYELGKNLIISSNGKYIKVD